ncbi:MAG: DUF4386 domain-containing protein [Anaerolineae bacterium]|nr:DUF4386 domain-containing protein [Anaerolineae bacterium]
MNSNRQTATLGTTPRKLAIAAGVLYLITHVTSIGAVILYEPVLKNADYILGAGSDAPVLLGGLLDILLALTVAGTSFALFPIVKRWNEGVALGYVGLRTLEAGIIAAGVVSLFAVVTLRQLSAGTSADPATLVTVGGALVGFYKGTFLLGPGFVCGVNTVLMAYLMYKSRLVPRFIPVLGLVGGPLIFAYSIARLFGVADLLQSLEAVLVFPIFAWEVTLALYLITKGFRLSAPTSEPAQTAANELLSAA